MNITVTDIIFLLILITAALILWKSISHEFYKSFGYEQRHKELMRENSRLKFENAWLRTELKDKNTYVNVTYRGRWDD